MCTFPFQSVNYNIYATRAMQCINVARPKECNKRVTLKMFAGFGINIFFKLLSATVMDFHCINIVDHGNILFVLGTSAEFLL